MFDVQHINVVIVGNILCPAIGRKNGAEFHYLIFYNHKDVFALAEGKILINGFYLFML